MTFTDVAIGIVEVGGRVLICRRKKETRFGGYWEFPGGKCESLEEPPECLRRELSEELGLVVEPLHAFPVIEHAYTKGPVRLHPFLCRVISGSPTALASDELRWVEPDRLFEYQFPPANDPLLARIIEQLRPASTRG
jgi:mutator protein MutT